MKTVKDMCDMIYIPYCALPCEECDYIVSCDMCEIAVKMILEGLY